MRQTNGQFAIGNPGGPGRPKRETEAAYLCELRDAVPLADWRAICERAATDAMAGDHKARTWLSTYLLPRVLDDAEPAEQPRLMTAEDLDAIFRQATAREAIENSERGDRT